MAGYYAFVTGLPDLVFDEHKKIFTIPEYWDSLKPLLSRGDRKIVQRLLLKQDNENLLAYLKDDSGSGAWKEGGLFSPADLADMVERVREKDLPEGLDTAWKRQWKKKYPEYLLHFLNFHFEKEEHPAVYAEDYLSGLYYDYLCNTRHGFLRAWAELNLNVRNTLTALSCRRNGTDYAGLIVGGNEVARLLRSTANPSHHLMEWIDYFDLLRNIDEKKDILEKERAIDQLLWNWLDEQTFFHYFDMEKIMSYLFKLQIIERWRNLDGERGELIFREMVSSLKKRAGTLQGLDT